MSEPHIRLTIEPQLDGVFCALAELVHGAATTGRLAWREDGHDVEAVLATEVSCGAVPGFVVTVGDSRRRIHLTDENPWCAQCLDEAFAGKLELPAERPAGAPDPAPRSAAGIALAARAPSDDTTDDARRLLAAVRLLVRRFDAARAVMLLGRTV